MYVESMGRTLQNLFKAYYSQLSMQDNVVAGKGDLVVVEEATLEPRCVYLQFYINLRASLLTASSSSELQT